MGGYGPLITMMNWKQLSIGHESLFAEMSVGRANAARFTLEVLTRATGQEEMVSAAPERQVSLDEDDVCLWEKSRDHIFGHVWFHIYQILVKSSVQ